MLRKNSASLKYRILTHDSVLRINITSLAAAKHYTNSNDYVRIEWVMLMLSICLPFKIVQGACTFDQSGADNPQLPSATSSEEEDESAKIDT